MFIRSVAGGKQRRATIGCGDFNLQSNTESQRRQLANFDDRKSSFATYMNESSSYFHEINDKEVNEEENILVEENILEDGKLIEEKEKRTVERETLIFHRIDEKSEKSKCPPVIKRRTKITLNVRGKVFETYESTLNVFPETLLGNKLSRDKYYNVATKVYVLNRCSYSFNAILFYYQSKGILSKPSDIDRELFLEELEFYQIREFIDMRHRQEIEFVKNEKLNKVLPTGKFRVIIWQSMEFHNKSIMTQCFFYFYLFTSLFALVIFCGETTDIGSEQLWNTLETVVNVAFSFEYGLRLYSSPNTKSFVISPCGVIDLIAIMPYYTNLFLSLIHVHDATVLPALTLLRVGRVFKLTRFHEGLHILMMTIYESLSHLLSLLLSILITSLLFASLMFHLEYKVVKDDNQFLSIPDSFWFTVITATGVGYGDMYPETTEGKIAGSMLAVIGVLLFCLPTPMLVNKFVECYYLRQKYASGGEIDTQRKNVINKMRELFLDH